MNSKRFLTTALFLLIPAILMSQEVAPNLPPAPEDWPPPAMSSPEHPLLPQLLAMCEDPPPLPGGGGGGPTEPAPGPRDYTVSGIPGVIAAGERWRFLWQEDRNVGDGIVGADDGSLLIAQDNNSQVLKLETDGTTSVEYSNTRTGGSLSINKNGEVFMVQRALRSAIVQMAPVRRILANNYRGGPLDCVGGNPNDLTADSKGGAYFSQGAVYYAAPNGIITQYGENIRPNGVILSADEQTLYVTNRQTIAAFDVQTDGSLTNQRVFATLEGGGNGDGTTIDGEGRLYVSTNPGVQVISPESEYLGIIPTPRGIISTAFSGPDKRTLFILACGASNSEGEQIRNAAQVYTIPMIAQGYLGRPK